MAQSVSDVLVFLFGFYLDVVLVSLGVEMFGDWSMESLLFPLFDVLEVVFLVVGGVGDESVLVREDEFLVVYVMTLETQVL